MNPRECAERWLQDLLKYHLIQPVIQPNLEAHMEFRYQLIQEYYAAECLLKLLPNLSNKQLRRDYLNYVKWTEPVALMLALVDSKAQATRVVQQALSVDWRLGARLAGEVKRNFQAQTVKFVEELEAPDWLRVELLGETRSDYATDSLLEAIKHSNSGVRWRAAEALGGIGSETAIAGLLEAIKHSKSEVRSSAAAALGHMAENHAAAIAPKLPDLLALISTDSGKLAYDLIRTIQENCKYYNYEIWCCCFDP